MSLVEEKMRSDGLVLVGKKCRRKKKGVIEKEESLVETEENRWVG